MLNKDNLNSLVLDSTKEVLEINDSITLETYFIGAESNISSIDIVQIISLVEEKLEESGIEGCDLFEKAFENASLTFSEFADLIEKEINS